MEIQIVYRDMAGREHIKEFFRQSSNRIIFQSTGRLQQPIEEGSVWVINHWISEPNGSVELL